ncbi:MAG: FAD:protein FMN transferase, partial [Solirubrobacterales bacterium]
GAAARPPATPEGARRAPARPDPAANWRRLGVNEEAATVTRPPGVRIDGGGIAKGLLADLLAADLEELPAFAVDCCGDSRFGGSADMERRLRVGNPFGGDTPLHELRLREGAVATSGISRRAWIGPDGAPAHQILDPASGRPAFTGLLQVTALAPSGLLAETYAKAALLSGPGRATEWLPHGGVLVAESGEVIVHESRRPLAEALAA